MVMGRPVNAALRSVWKQRIDQQRRSRLSVAEFCRQERLSPQSFYAWRGRLRADERPSSRSSWFVPVELPAASTTAEGLRIELPSGVVMTLPTEAATELVIAAIQAVMSGALQEQSPC
jgi:hypothetical protein